MELVIPYQFSALTISSETGHFCPCIIQRHLSWSGLKHGVRASTRLLKSRTMSTRRICSQAAVWWKTLAFVHSFPQSHRGCHMLHICLTLLDGFLNACGVEPNTFLCVCVKVAGYEDRCGLAQLVFSGRCRILPDITCKNQLGCEGRSALCGQSVIDDELVWYFCYESVPPVSNCVCVADDRVAGEHTWRPVGVKLPHFVLS